MMLNAHICERSKPYDQTQSEQMHEAAKYSIMTRMSKRQAGMEARHLDQATLHHVGASRKQEDETNQPKVGDSRNARNNCHGRHWKQRPHGLVGQGSVVWYINNAYNAAYVVKWTWPKNINVTYMLPLLADLQNSCIQGFVSVLAIRSQNTANVTKQKNRNSESTQADNLIFGYVLRLITTMPLDRKHHRHTTNG